MRISRASLALGALAAALLAAGIPALGQQQQTPESILPPGFNDPIAQPSPEATQPGTAPGAVPPPIVATAPGEAPLPLPGVTPTPTATPTPPSPQQLAQYEMPDFARRSLASVGPVGQADGGLAPNAFGRADGRMIETLMRRLDTPIASRWVEITLRRALVSKIDTPPQINGADFAAERAWLLLRMGEAVAARGVVQNVDSDNYTPKLYQMALQTALANGDPAALCSVADAGAALARERAWVLARAMCAGLAGTPGAVTPIFNAARKAGLANGIDLLLAQKVAGAGMSGRQAVTIEWAGVDRLTAWRYGLAMATAVDIPDDLLGTTSPQLKAWRALSPVLPPRTRIAPAEDAAVRGVFSNAALVDLYSSLDPGDDQAQAQNATASDIGTAYNGADVLARMAALKNLWGAPDARDAHYARLILTAGAAARIPAGSAGVDADNLVAAMLSAGMDRTALRWHDSVSRGSDAWAMLALADPDFSVHSYGDIGAYSGTGDSGLKRRMFFAGMAGLRRLSVSDIERGAQSLGVAIGAENAWTRAIDAAARRNEPGLVILLAGTGMQTRDWRGVSPEALYHIVAALRATGLEGPARMIAVEAITRL